MLFVIQSFYKTLFFNLNLILTNILNYRIMKNQPSIRKKSYRSRLLFLQKKDAVIERKWA